MNRIAFVFCLAFQYIIFPCYAQKYAFEHLTVDDGLSNSTVTSICQDSRGFMWFGTNHGLNRYDGYVFKAYLTNRQDSLSISDNNVSCLYEDSRKTLWVGTHSAGLNRYNRERDAFEHYTLNAHPPYRLSANEIECIFEDSRGNLWVGTNDGLNLFDQATHTFQIFQAHPNDPTALNSSQVYSIIENDRREVLILTSSGVLNRYSPRTGGFVQEPIAGPPAGLSTARTLYQDRQHRYWVGGLDFGLLRSQDGQVAHYHHLPGQPRSLGRDQVRAILQTSWGGLWFGTDGGGISVYEPASDDFTRIGADETSFGSLKSPAVYCLYEDRAGTVWVGTFGGGVSFYSPYKATFARYAHLPGVSNSLGNRSVLALLEQADGRVWVGTDGGGLDVFDPLQKTFRHFRHDPANPASLSADVVKALYKDRQGQLWVGTYLGGLNRYDPAHHRFLHYTADPNKPTSLANNIVWNLYEDRHNQLWVSTLGSGVCLMDRVAGTFTRFHPFTGPGSLDDTNVVTMQEDGAGNLWLGTEDHGLNLYHPSGRTFSYVRHDPKAPRSLSSDRIQALFKDSRGLFWVGTADAGLDLMGRDQRTFQHFTTRQGLPSNVINSIVEDRAGNLWVSTNKGIARVAARTHRVKAYDRENDLQSTEFSINSALLARNGDVYSGGFNGFNVFSPAGLVNNPAVPPVVLTDVQVFDKSVRPGRTAGFISKPITEADTLVLSYKESAVTLQFAALNFIDPHKNQYAYQLEGFDTEWRYAGTRHEATYTNLDPGKYTFRVKAANNDGVWNTRGTALTVIITPPWWKTGWFRVLAALAVLGGAATVSVLRTNRLRRELQLERMQELRETRLEHEKALVEMSKSQLEAEVLHKNSELATSVMSVVQQNEALLTIRDKIKAAVDDPDAAQQRKQMLRIVRQIEREVTPDQHWNHFEELFNQLHENFMQRLRETYPQLTGRDIKLCAYLRMNLNSKEMAALMGLSLRGIEDLRYRVRKKMGLDTTLNLAEFILSM